VCKFIQKFAICRQGKIKIEATAFETNKYNKIRVLILSYMMFVLKVLFKMFFKRGYCEKNRYKKIEQIYFDISH